MPKLSKTVVKANQPCPCGASSDAMQCYGDGSSFCYSAKCGGTYIPPAGSLDKGKLVADYIPIRGLSIAALKTYDIRSIEDEEGELLWTSFVFPNGEAQFRDLTVDENALGKYYNIKGKKPEGLFGRDKFPAGSAKYVTVTEGAFDAASAWMMLNKFPVVSLSPGKVITDEDWAYLNSFERIYLCLDNDEAGRALTEKIVNKFSHKKLFIVRLNKFNDPNDYLTNGAEKDFVSEWWKAEPYKPDNILTSSSDFLSEFTEVKDPLIAKTDFSGLDALIRGLPTGYIVLLKGEEGKGKTEFLRSLAYTLYTKTKHSFATVFMEESPRRTLQGFATLALGAPVHLPDSTVPPQHVKDFVKELGESGRVSILKLVDTDNNENVLNQIRYLVTQRESKFVFLDPVNQLASVSGENATKDLDRLMVKLAKMVTDLDFCLIMTAHVNDDGKTRDSRMIEKAASIRIELSRDHMDKDPIVKNTTKISVSKNRPFASTGFAGSIYFDPDTYGLTEKLDTPIETVVREHNDE